MVVVSIVHCTALTLDPAPNEATAAAPVVTTSNVIANLPQDSTARHAELSMCLPRHQPSWCAEQLQPDTLPYSLAACGRWW